MARKFIFSPGEYYHIYHRGVDKRKIFLDRADYRRFLTTLFVANNTAPTRRSDYLYHDDGIYELGKEMTLVDIGCYALLPNHFHLLVHEHTEGGMSKFAQRFLTAYTMYFNKRYQRTGPLLGGKFRAEHAKTDRYLKYLYAYIHLNPLSLKHPKWKDAEQIPKKEWVAELTRYQFSSLPDYLENMPRKQKAIIKPDAFPDYFGCPEVMLDDLADWITVAKNVKVEP